jgi:uncharacterized membrane protein
MKKSVNLLILCSVMALLFLELSVIELNAKETPTLASWTSTFSPYGVWKKTYDNPFPCKLIIKNVANQGITDVNFFIQAGRGGPFMYSTKVKHCVVEKKMEGRDYLEEILTEADKYDLSVWLGFTTPLGCYPNTDIKGLNDPRMLKLYEDVITDVCERYGKHKSLAGFIPHELDCTEMEDTHSDDREEFSSFCEKKFGEKYTEAMMPPQTDAKNKWWRRYALYKNEIMNNFNRMVTRVCNKYGVKNQFCYYGPESGAGTWAWGYDLVSLENICHNFWASGNMEKNKMYQNINGMFIDFGFSYKGANLSRNITYAFHGKPLCYFEFRCPNYPDVVRKFYSSNKRFTKMYGDFYTGYSGKPQKALDIFFGQKNMKNWTGLATSWQGGKSPAKIAVAQAVVPFYLKYPLESGIKYNNQIVKLMQGLTLHADIDALLMECNFALQPEKLLKYKLIIIPEDIGHGLSAKMLDSLREYVQKGGKLLVIASPLVQSDQDLTNEIDVTEKFCGVRVMPKKGIGGYIKAESPKMALPGKKFWSPGLRNIHLSDTAKVLVKEKFTDTPILTQKGNVYYSAIGFAPEAADYFGAVLKQISPSPVELENSSGIRIVEATQKDNALCLAFYDQGKGILKVNTQELGLKGELFQVKNILTGVVLHEADKKRLTEGVEVEIKYLNQPYILAVAPAKDLASYPGIFLPSETFEGMDKVIAIENPEVAIAVPDRPGIKIGIYHGGYGTNSIFKLLENEKGLNPFILPRLDGACLEKCDVIIIPQGYTSTYINQAEKIIRNCARNGKGVLLTHNAVGYKKIIPLFPEIGKGKYKARNAPVHISKKSHPVTEKMQLGQEFSPGFMYDHIALSAENNKDTIALVENDKGAPVILAGKFGKGRVILNGMLPGRKGSWSDSSGKPGAPEETEKELLIKSIKWLTGKE